MGTSCATDPDVSILEVSSASVQPEGEAVSSLRLLLHLDSVAQFTAEGGYYFKILSDARKTVFVYTGASALAGYETVNWGDKVLHDGAMLHDKDSFIYGGALTLDVEFYVADRVALLANLRERCLWGNSTRHFHTQFGLGVKFIIN